MDPLHEDITTPDIAALEDGSLLELYVRTGGMEYFGELYTRYTPLIYGLCLKYLRSVEAAEDAVMEIFELLAPKLERYNIGEFRTWVYSVARNHCLQQLRRKNPVVCAEMELARVESDDMAHLLSKQQGERLLTALEECIEELPLPQKVSIRMFFIEERSYADVADATKYHIKSVKSYIQNGKRNLKKCIEEKRQ